LQSYSLSNFDHIRFAETIKKCKRHWFITYDGSDYVRELCSFATILTWNLKYGMQNVTAHSNQIGKELLISNYLIKLPERNLQERQLSLL